MPRRQRFKPSRKPKPAIEPSENDIVLPTAAKASSEPEQRGESMYEDRHRAEERVEARIEERVSG